MNQTKARIERYYVEEFLKTLGVTDYKIDEAHTDKPDVLVIMNGRKIGIEVTEFHWDEREKGGSPSRPKEMQLLRDNKPYFAWSGSPFRALEKRVKNKIDEAKDYKPSELNELWLLVVLQGVEAVGSQYAHPLYFKDEKGKSELSKLHEPLMNSRYDQAYLYFHIGKCIIGWLPNRGWEPADYNNPPEVPSLKEIIRDEEWLNNPTKKAREEANKAIEELRSKK